MAGRQMNKHVHIKYYLFELFYNFTSKVYYLQYSKASSLRENPQLHYNVENSWPSNMVSSNRMCFCILKRKMKGSAMEKSKVSRKVMVQWRNVQANCKRWP